MTEKDTKRVDGGDEAFMALLDLDLSHFMPPSSGEDNFSAAVNNFDINKLTPPSFMESYSKWSDSER